MLGPNENSASAISGRAAAPPARVFLLLPDRAVVSLPATEAMPGSAR